MKKRRYLFVILIAFLVATTMIISVAAQQRTPGISEGDQFKYGDINIQWSSDFPNDTFPLALEALNDTEYLMMSVEDVSNTNITLEMTKHLKNGTEETQQGYINVDTGASENVTFLPVPVISEGLQENDTVYTSSMFAGGRINETMTREYPDGIRETNHLNITNEQSTEQEYQFLSSNYYWDKTTGMIVEVSEESEYQAGELNRGYSVQVRITQSNKWAIPEFPSPLALTLFMATTILIGIVTRRKLKATPDKET